MPKYRIKQSVTIPNEKEDIKQWPKDGTLLPLKDENNKLLAKFEVKHVTEKEIKGTVVTTYGHKRRKQ